MAYSQLLLISVSACLLVYSTAIVSTRSPHVAPIGKCQPNETYIQCSTCEKTCTNKNPICNKMCGPPKCQCGSGFYRSSKGSCVRMNDCENNSTDNSTGTTCHSRNCPMGTLCLTIAPRCFRCRPIPMCIPMNRNGDNGRKKNGWDDNNMNRNDRSDGMYNYNSVENDVDDAWMENDDRSDNYPRRENGQDNGGNRDNDNQNLRDWMNSHLGPRFGPGNRWQNEEKYPRHGDGGWNNGNQNAHDGDDNIQNPRNGGWNNDQYPRNGGGNNENQWNGRWHNNNENSRNNGNDENDFPNDMDTNWNGHGSHNQRGNQWGNQENEWNTRGKREDDISENTEMPPKEDDSQSSEKPSNEEESDRDDSA